MSELDISDSGLSGVNNLTNMIRCSDRNVTLSVLSGANVYEDKSRMKLQSVQSRGLLEIVAMSNS